MGVIVRCLAIRRTCCGSYLSLAFTFAYYRSLFLFFSACPDAIFFMQKLNWCSNRLRSSSCSLTGGVTVHPHELMIFRSQVLVLNH